MKNAQKLYTLDAEKGIIELSIEQAKEIVTQNEKQVITKKAYSPEEARKIIGLGRIPLWIYCILAKSKELRPVQSG